MDDAKLSKEYKSPLFVLIRLDESNKVYFTASGTPGEPAIVGLLESMSSTSVSW